MKQNKKAFMFFKKFISKIKAFKIFNNNIFKKIFNKTNKFSGVTSRVVKASLSLGLAGILMFCVCAVTGIVFACEISVNGIAVGCVENEGEVIEVKKLAKNKISDDNGKKVIDNISSNHIITGTQNITKAENIIEPLLENSEEIKEISYLKLNGKYLGYNFSENTLKDILEEYLNNKTKKSGLENAEFEESVETGLEYISTKSILNINEILTVDDITEDLPVLTTKTYTQNETIGFSTVNEKTSDLLIGYSKVKTEGVNGEKEVTYKVCYKNGQEISKSVLNEKTLKEAQNKVVLVGSKDPAEFYSKAASSTAKASGNGFIWPLAKAERSYVSAYYGDGRNHKGMDICAPKGTAIYAASGGTVELAGYSGAYGLNIIINHGNEVKTRYAHCSKLFVNVGNTVYQGENIAAVGTTGQVTGPHLHFEVLVNGYNVNPSGYIGG